MALPIPDESSRLEGVLRLGLELASHIRPHGLLATLCEDSRRLFGADYAGAAVLSDDGRTPGLFVASGLGDLQLQPPRGDGLLGGILAHGQPVFYRHEVGDPIDLGLPPEHPVPGCLLGVPLATPGRVYGWHYVARADGFAGFNGEDARVASMVAASAAVAYENLLRFDEIRRHANHLQVEIAERRQAERRYRDVFEGAVQGIFQSTPSGRILVANPAFATMVGYGSPEEMCAGITDVAAQLYVDPARRADLLKLLAGQDNVLGFEAELRRRDGGTLWARSNVRAVRGEDGQLLYCEGIVEDITERKQADLRLRRNEEEYRLLFEMNPLPMWVFDEETLRFLAVNESAVRHYGWSREEFLAMTLTDIRPPPHVPGLLDWFTRVEEYRRRGRVSSIGERIHWKKDGTELLAQISLSPILFRDRKAWLVLAEDITARKALETELLRAHKLEAVGRLAGGVAHDFNNLLMVIRGCVDLTLPGVPHDSPVRELVEEIGQAAQRAAALTRQLLSLSRKQVLEPRVLDLNEVVADVDHMLRRLIGEDIVIRILQGAGLGSVRIDPGQVEQILMNLALNARDAMPDGGELSIETRNVELRDPADAVDLPAGSYVSLTVTDTGCGMDEATRSRVFEPFFTTKEEGRGTGLGLAIVYGIALQNGGAMKVESEPGRGSRFTLYLPRVESRAERPGDAQPASSSTRGGEAILLAEDDASVRAITRHMLERDGYRVTEAGDGNAALSAFQSRPEGFDLLITDVVMPGMGGRELARRVRNLRPGAKVLYVSGYTRGVFSDQRLVEPGAALLAKPYSQQALAARVRELLDAAGAEAQLSDRP